jgi:hypothetical protein
MIPCKHWQDCKKFGGGCCDLGLYGGSPSYGVCVNICPRYKGPRTVPKAPPGKKRGCGGCKEAKPGIVRWAGVRWYGVPDPLRRKCPRHEPLRAFAYQLWQDFGAVRDEPYKGCGCIVKTKAVYEAVRRGIDYIRRA